jgi:hypothetical protein
MIKLIFLKKTLIKIKIKLIKIKSMLLGIHSYNMQFYNIKISREKFCVYKKSKIIKRIKK